MSTRDSEPKAVVRTREAGLLNSMEWRAVAHFTGDMTEACRRAGYKFPNVAASKLLKRPHVIAALQKKQEAMARTTGSNAASLETGNH